MKQHHLKLNENNSTILFLFSGTGNSLNAAIRIQENIENCEILSIPEVLEEKKITYEAAKIGFIFPVHFLDAPNIVREFLKNIKITGNSYVFAVATSGGEIGKTFQTINKLLDLQNRKLHSEFSLVLPSNSIIMEDRSSTPEVVDRLIKNSEVRINEIIKIITNNEIEKFIPTRVSFKNRFGSLMGRIFLYGIFNDRRFKVDKEKCIRCGTCVSVCPMNNIEIVDDKVTYNHNCEVCLACIHWCPRNAIEHFNTRGIPRYHHPNIKVKHMRDYKSKS
ncbi:MAG: 4Fe-4S binding protein [Asgard group archaeon]|nr:4Fe-4S binding protein [Asgard group archaeon]